MKNYAHFIAFVFSLFCQNLSAQLFTQDFNDTNNVPDYIGSPPSNMQFDGITTSGSGVMVSITNNTLQFTRTNANSGAFTRSTDFSPVPTTLGVRFDLNVVASSTTNTTAAQFCFGSGFVSNNSVPANSTVHTKIGINTIAGGGFQIQNIAAGQNSLTFTGTRIVRLYINNSGGTVSYLNPDGTGFSSTVANDKTDVWVDDVQVFDELAATTTTQTLPDFKMVLNGGEDLTIRWDDFLMLSALNQLPVELSRFTAVANPSGQSVQLDWETATENNSAFFAIERSADGSHFEEIGKENAAGNSTSSRLYQFTDSAPLPGIAYYRLRQVDLDGSFEFSPIRVVSLEKPGSGLRVFPTLASDEITIQSDLPGEGFLEIFDLNGKWVTSEELPEGEAKISVASLPVGSYVAVLRRGGNVRATIFEKR